jgi:putative transposase
MLAVVARFTAFRFALLPSPGQEALLCRHAGAARFAYNRCLGLVKEHLQARSADPSVKVPWSGFDLINTFNAWKHTGDAGRQMVVDSRGVVTVRVTGLRWRAEVCQQVFEEAAVDLGRGLAAFSAARKSGSRRRVGFPRFKRKKAGMGSFRIRAKVSKTGAASIRVGGDIPRSVTLPRIGVVPVRDDTRRLRRILAGDRVKLLSATVSHRHGRWTVSILVEAADLHPARHHPPRDDADSGGWIGVDRGLTAFIVAATADGRQVLRVDDPPRPMRATTDRIRRRSRDLSRTQPASANRRDAAARLARAHARVRAIRQRFHHEVANRLVNTHDRIALEDLHIAGMTANHRLAAAIADAGWADFARIVAYKQAWRGGQVMSVDRWFPSSKTCSHCRTTVTSMPLPVRTFHCPACGLTVDRDLNAATNLATWADEHHARVRDPERTRPGQQRPPRHPPHPRQRRGNRDGADNVETPPDTITASSRDVREGRCFTIPHGF